MTTILFGFATLGLNSKFPFDCQQIGGRTEKLIQTSTNPFQWQFGTSEEEKKLIPITEGLSPQEEASALSTVWRSLKTNLREGFLTTQKTINTKVCEAIVGQLKAVYQNPVFQIGVVFGLYLLLYGVIRLLVWMITIVSYVLFWLMRLFGCYRVEKRAVEVEEVVG